MPFLISAGQMDKHEMWTASHALTKVWGGGIAECSCDDSPKKRINKLIHSAEMVVLFGDPGSYLPDEGSWMEALGARRVPTILVATPHSSGSMPGSAAAYAALCDHLRIPLIGVVQFGGPWEPKQRFLDGLPWCGRIPVDVSIEKGNGDSLQESVELELEELVGIMKRRFSTLKK